MIVVNEDTGELSNTFMQVTTENGDVAPSILCVSTSLEATLTWTKAGAADLPAGITETNVLSQTRQVVKLDWMKKMHFTDSGRYMCTISKGDQSNTIIGINLLVQCKSLHVVL